MAKRRPIVSIIIPVFNAEKSISKCFDSLKNQTFKDFEVLFVDDSSTDKSFQICEQLASTYNWVSVYKTASNSGGPAVPRNIGIEKSRGNLICFLDADDYWHPDKLGLQIECSKSNPESAFFCASMLDFKDDETLDELLMKHQNVETPKIETLDYKSQLVKLRLPLSSWMIRDFAIKSERFNVNRSLAGREDYLMALQILYKHGPCKKMSVPLMYYRKHEGQLSGAKLSMLRRHFNLLRASKSFGLPRLSLAAALFYLATHIIGSIYLRAIKNRL